MNLEEDYVSTGEPFSKHVWKARDFIKTKRFCDLFNKLLMSAIPGCFAESRTVFIPETSDTDDLGRTVRSRAIAIANS